MSVLVERTYHSSGEKAAVSRFELCSFDGRN